MMKKYSSLIRSCPASFVFPSSSSSSLQIRKFSSQGDGKDSHENRGEQSKGATHSYYRSQSQSAGIFGQMKQNIGPHEIPRPTYRDDAGTDDASQSAPRTPRIMNKKFSRGGAGSGKAWPAPAGGDADEGAAPAQPAQRFRRRGGSDDDNASISDDDDSKSDDDKIPPPIRNLLFDAEHLQELLLEKDAREPGQLPGHARGYTYDFDDSDEPMDAGDAFLFHAVTECLKTEDGVYRTVAVSREFHNVRLPVARPALNLLMTTIPDLRERPDSMGYKLGSNAWQVLSKNYYYSEADCKYMSSAISRVTNKLLKQAEKDFTVDM